ncbi:putative serine protease PepD [Micromonospora pattaloongensis]|uniref:Putative serine protease PepD n=1 Tax=Micromonospora pattaloongensis TaxID=405436 RepID=A0A1H3GR02_9ACTN|nr:trypsin-like peptidase domain-containing protein [Micromonospora pattaloongensis]SDY05480.1 putative serine protease PepD [Micromonospora pattaloongensis]
MTDGWNWRQPDGTVPAYPPPSGGPPAPAGGGASAGSSPWWSDARNDPWRDPRTPAAIVVSTPPPDAGAVPEPVVDPDAPSPRRLGPVFVVALVTALLAGALGGGLGYALALRGGLGPGGALGAVAAEPPALAKRPADSLAGVAERVRPSVVTVRVNGGVGASVGSGFVATADGYVITNDHVVEAAGSSGAATVVFSDGSTASAKVVGKDPESDLAVIKVSRGGLVPVEFGDSDAIAVGDPVLAFGSPLALANTVTAGIVSALDRTIQAGEPGGQVRYYAAIQTDAAVNQGNSGGPLVDAAGRVVGVNSVIKSLAVDEQQAGNIGLAFAIPINQAKRVTRDIIDTGKARRTVIGAQVTDAGRASGSGVRLSAVTAGGPAAGGGLRAGDVVLKIDGRPLAEATDLIALVRKYPPGAVVTVEYRRGSAVQRSSVTLAADAK